MLCDVRRSEKSGRILTSAEQCVDLRVYSAALVAVHESNDANGLCMIDERSTTALSSRKSKRVSCTAAVACFAARAAWPAAADLAAGAAVLHVYL